MLKEKGCSGKKDNKRPWLPWFFALAACLLIAWPAVLESGGLPEWPGGQRREARETGPGGQRQEARETGPGDGTAQIVEGEEAEEKAREILSCMTLEEKAAQLFIITPEQLTGLDRVTRADSATEEALEKYPVGGLVYFSGNLEEEGQLSRMLSAVQAFALDQMGIPLFLAIDEEGGDIARIGNHKGFRVPEVPRMSEIGRTEDPRQAYEAGSAIGAYLKGFGFNMDFAPDADVLTNPDNPVVKTRSFGADPKLVSDMASAYLDGLMEQGVYGVPKHFPGHGATEGDSHKGFAYADKTWEQLEEAELKPFYAMIGKQAPFLMAGHISLPLITGDDTPGSLSGQVLNGYLRDEMGYEGVIVTDALNMGAIRDNYPSGQASVMAFQAGADLLLMPEDFQAAYEAVLEAARDGRISRERLDGSVLRILKAKAGMEPSYGILSVELYGVVRDHIRK